MTLSYFQIPNLSLKKRQVTIELCNIVATHGACLAVAGIYGILKKVGRDTLSSQKTAVAMFGGLYEHYNKFRECLESTLKELLGDQVYQNITIVHANDGSSIGDALLAASHPCYLDAREF